jgi:hypothetical protein
MKTVTLITCFIMLIQISSAQVATPSMESHKVERSIFGLGFSAGTASGFGLSFRHHLPGDFSYQVVAGVIKADRRTSYDIGSELQFDLVHGELSRFFACGAFGYFYSGENSNELDASFRSGLGIGIEKGTSQALNLSAELLFTFFSDGTILPLPQVGIHYYFF